MSNSKKTQNWSERGRRRHSVDHVCRPAASAVPVLLDDLRVRTPATHLIWNAQFGTTESRPTSIHQFIWCRRPDDDRPEAVLGRSPTLIAVMVVLIAVYGENQWLDPLASGHGPTRVLAGTFETPVPLFEQMWGFENLTSEVRDNRHWRASH